jgi:hypothetical protein
MPKFTASDGAGFDDRRAYRKYEFELSYTFKKQRGSPDAPLELRKEPGAIEGQPFEMAELADCTVVLLDHSEAIQVDYLVNCRVFIGACCDSVFVRNCTGCTFTMACKQLRTRECVDCTFYLYTMTEPVIEMSNDVRFAPFNGAYPEHPSHMEEAGLDPSQNLWFAVFDFNDDAKTGKNWKLLAESEEEGVWCPGSDKAMATSTIPRVVAGSIPVPSEVEAAAKAAASGGGMQSFALGTSQADAEAAYAATAGEEEEEAAAPAPIRAAPTAPAAPNVEAAAAAEEARLKSESAMTAAASEAARVQAERDAEARVDMAAAEALVEQEEVQDDYSAAAEKEAAEAAAAAAEAEQEKARAVNEAQLKGERAKAERRAAAAASEAAAAEAAAAEAATVAVAAAAAAAAEDEAAAAATSSGAIATGSDYYEDEEAYEEGAMYETSEKEEGEEEETDGGGGSGYNDSTAMVTANGDHPARSGSHALDRLLTMPVKKVEQRDLTRLPVALDHELACTVLRLAQTLKVGGHTVRKGRFAMRVLRDTLRAQKRDDVDAFWGWLLADRRFIDRGPHDEVGGWVGG